MHRETSDSFEAVILAGGEGSRLVPFTNTCPKPLIQIVGKPILEYIVDEVKKCEIEDIAISVRYLKEQIISYIDGRHRCFETDSDTMVESFLDVAQHCSKDYLLCLSADTLISRESLSYTIDTHLSSGSDITLTLVPNKQSKKRWRYETNSDSYLTNIGVSEIENNNLERAGMVINRNLVGDISKNLPFDKRAETYSTGWNLILKMMLDEGKSIYLSQSETPVYNINKKSDLGGAESFVFKYLKE